MSLRGYQEQARVEDEAFELERGYERWRLRQIAGGVPQAELKHTRAAFTEGDAFARGKRWRTD